MVDIFEIDPHNFACQEVFLPRYDFHYWNSCVLLVFVFVFFLSICCIQKPLLFTLSGQYLIQLKQKT